MIRYLLIYTILIGIIAYYIPKIIKIFPFIFWFDKKYVSNGYFYTYDDNWSSPNQITTIEGTGYYPQAGINFLIGLTTSF